MEPKASLTWSANDFFESCERCGISLSSQQRIHLKDYVESLYYWNKRHNLVSRADVRNIWPRHIMHSILPVAKLSIPIGMRVLDIGSGAGLPGIPISILRPDLEFTLLDSIKKKTDALQMITKKVGVQNVQVINSRVESPTFVNRFSDYFDFALARSVTVLSKLAAWAIPVLRNSPRLELAYPAHDSPEKLRLAPPALLAYKGGDLSRELKAVIPQSWCYNVLDLTLEGLKDSGLSEKKLVIVSQERRP